MTENNWRSSPEVIKPLDGPGTVSRKYRIDITKVSYREVWSWGNWFLFAGFALRKLLGRPWYSRTLAYDPAITILEADKVREDLRLAILPAVSEAATCGCRVLFHYRRDPPMNVEMIAAALMHETRLAVCLVVFAAGPILREVNVSAISRVDARRFVATGNGVQKMITPPEIDSLSLRGAGAREILDTHMRRIAGQAITPLQHDEVKGLILDLQTAITQAHVRRGLYVPVG